MTQTDAVHVVLRERTYQDKTYDPNEKLPSGLTRMERDREVQSHLVLLDSYIRRAKDAWTFTRKDDTSTFSSSFAATREIAKIAAIALRALERLPDGNRLLAEGLRDKAA